MPPFVNLYTSYCHYCYNDEINLSISVSYYYNDIRNNGKVFEISEDTFKKKLEFIGNYNPLIVLYYNFE